ncbi:MAG: bifunctional hydroxymethylpyrimidine kinase/phosphomethylpyrimidine kinase [Thermodesulfobacteriota bacterium]
MTRRALSIAGFDATGLAGLLADVLVFQSLGLEAMAVPTAITVQDLESVTDVAPVEPWFISSQIESLFRGPAIDAVKIGMLAAGAGARTVAEALQDKEQSPPVIVLDPVLASTGGTPLIDEEGITVIKDSLIPLCTLVTPNMQEASILSDRLVLDSEDMRQAALAIHNNLKADAVLVKGGHLEGRPLDILFDGSEFTEFEGQRLKGPRGIFHGTGCLLSSAITAGLAKGLALKDAVRQGKDHTAKILMERKKVFPHDKEGG